MAEEPQPTKTPAPLTEDTKAAAALSALDTHHTSDDAHETSNVNADATALSNAVSNLSFSAGEGKGSTASAAGAATTTTTTTTTATTAGTGTGTGAGAGSLAETPKKKVKIEAADVTFLMDELELSKVKATDLLRVHGGDRGLAVRAFVLA